LADRRIDNRAQSLSPEIELEFRNDFFKEGGKPENPEKIPRSKGENQQQTQLTYI
jgi:hypothetical protein